MLGCGGVCHYKVAILENIVNLDSGGKWGPSDRTLLEDIYQSLGYHLDFLVHDAPDSQCAQARQRYYGVAVLELSEPLQPDGEAINNDQVQTGGEASVGLLEKTNGELKKYTPEWVNDLHRFFAAVKKAPVHPLGDFLLPEVHPDIVLLRSNPGQVWHKAKKQKQMLFETDHMEIFTRVGYTYPPTTDDLEDHMLTDAISHLPRRMQETAYFHTRSFQEQSADDDDTTVAKETVDINKTLQWNITETTRAAVCCLASSSKIWLLGRRRELCGHEALLLQGWEIGDLHHEPLSCLPFASRTLCSIAGNAMNGFADCKNVGWPRHLVAMDSWCTKRTVEETRRIRHSVSHFVRAHPVYPATNY